MTNRTLVNILAGVVILSLLSTSASLFIWAVARPAWPQGWTTINFVLFGVITLAALVWMTGLTRRFRLSMLATAGLALGLGVVILLSSSALTELLFSRVAPRVVPDWPTMVMPTRIDVAWAIGKLPQAVLLLIPFATWRAFQQRRVSREACPPPERSAII